MSDYRPYATERNASLHRHTDVQLLTATKLELPVNGDMLAVLATGNRDARWHRLRRASQLNIEARA